MLKFEQRNNGSTLNERETEKVETAEIEFNLLVTRATIDDKKLVYPKSPLKKSQVLC